MKTTLFPPKPKFKKGNLALVKEDMVLSGGSVIPKGTVVTIASADRFFGYDIVSVEDDTVWATEVGEEDLEKVGNL